jgi:LysM repeat protein
MGTRTRTSRIVRYASPVVFLLLVVGLVVVVLKSGALSSSAVSPSLSASAASSATPRAAGTYKIRQGDTLSEIAAIKHTTVTKILALNPGLDQNNLRVGQRIKIPAPD